MTNNTNNEVSVSTPIVLKKLIERIGPEAAAAMFADALRTVANEETDARWAEDVAKCRALASHIAAKLNP